MPATVKNMPLWIHSYLKTKGISVQSQRCAVLFLTIWNCKREEGNVYKGFKITRGEKKKEEKHKKHFGKSQALEYDHDPTQPLQIKLELFLLFRYKPPTVKCYLL